MTTPSIINGVQVDAGQPYPYVGVGFGRTEYRIYQDREGWFRNGEYQTLPPKGKSASRIKQAIEQAGLNTFLDYLRNGGEKWQLKEKAGI